MDGSKLQMREGKSTRKREASECGAAFSVTESCQMWAKTPRRARKEDGILVSSVAPQVIHPIILPPPLLLRILGAKSHSYTTRT